MDNKKIVVVGGGTAGMLTALWARKHLPDSSVTVLKSVKAPSIGVGEASTPNLVGFLENLGIDPLHALKEAGGTVKNGISFEEWGARGSKYFHGFQPTGRLEELLKECTCPPHFNAGVYDYYTYKAIEQSQDLDKVLYSNMLAYSNKVDTLNASWAMQFDAVKLARYLEGVALVRNIKIVEGHYSGTLDKEDGSIEGLVLEGGKVLPLDLLFDCSGFARLFIGKKFQQEWESYGKHLPMKQAIPFRVPKAAPLPSYTKAIAMKYGWMWYTPLQDMVGMGYVYDSDYINAEEAQQEAEEYLGTPIQVRTVLDFEIGQYKKVWVKNCIAVGLSTGFAEPLEATAIHRSISQLEDLRHFINHIFEYNEDSVSSYNSQNYRDNRSVLDFIYLHYITKRKDSPFWQEFRARNPVPESLQGLLKLLKDRNLRFFDVPRDQLWALTNYLQVSEGLGIPENPISMEGYQVLRPTLEERTQLFQHFLDEAENHEDFMLNLVGRPIDTEK